MTLFHLHRRVPYLSRIYHQRDAARNEVEGLRKEAEGLKREAARLNRELRFHTDAAADHSPKQIPRHFDRRRNLPGETDISSTSGIEFGPLMSPIVTRDMGDITYIDHDTTDNIKTDPNVDVSRIVNIDLVSDGRPLRDIVGGRNFDYILASHVFEHVANPIAWLQDCGSILAHRGLLGLAIPDKRFTFDFFKDLTGLHDWIGAYIEKRERPSPATVFENAVLTNGYDFSQLVQGERCPRFLNPVNLHWAYSHAREVQSRYIDVHCTTCTAESFASPINQSRAVGLHRFEIEAIFPTRLGWNEFQVRLRLW